MSGLFGSVTIPGQRLTEFAFAGSQIGIPIPFGFGEFPCEGNPIFAPMPPKEHVKKKKQGKGGVNTTEYTYTLSYAIAFCRGPIFGFLTIKRNGKIVWTQDPTATVEDQAYAAKWAQKATFYYGTKTQLPDSTIESYKGAGQVSAFRNLAYIVVEDDIVNDSGGAVPTYEAVVIANGVAYATSPPYPVEVVESLEMQAGYLRGELNDLLEAGYSTEKLSIGAAMIAGVMRQLRQDGYTPSEKITIGAALAAGSMATKRFDGYAPPESIAIGATMASGSMATKRLDAVLPEEKIAFTATMVGGFLGAP